MYSAERTLLSLATEIGDDTHSCRKRIECARGDSNWVLGTAHWFPRVVLQSVRVETTCHEYIYALHMCQKQESASPCCLHASNCMHVVYRW